MIRIVTSQFCALAHDEKFQEWLRAEAEDLMADLLGHLEAGHGCRSNRQKMIEVYEVLKSRRKLDGLTSFLRSNYPFMLREEGKRVARRSNTKRGHDGRPVFARYRPGLLTFPHKTVLMNDNPVALRRDALKFCSRMVGCDWVIVGNAAFIEYFKPQYAAEAEQVTDSQYEVKEYRRRHGQSTRRAQR